MKNLRLFGTGATIITFIVVGITGVLMFFGIKGGALKSMHEYIGVAMVVFTFVHIFVNFKPFTNYFKGFKGVSIVLSSIIIFAYIAYDFTQPKPTNWKKGMAYEKLIKLDINTAMNIFNGNQNSLNNFLNANNLSIPQNISIREFAKQNRIKENDLLDAMLK